MFEQTVARLGLVPSECCHVGDHPDVDVRGALAAGLRAIWNEPVLGTAHRTCADHR